MLTLTILSRRGPTHGYGIANAIQEISEEALRVDEGSLYPALHRMEEAGWITAEWTITENKRRARIYRRRKRNHPAHGRLHAGRGVLEADRIALRVQD